MITYLIGEVMIGLFAPRMVAVGNQRKGTRSRRDLALPPLSHAGACWTILVIDCSGSMAREDFPPNRLTAAKRAAIEYVRARVRRSPEDHVAVVGFSGTARIALPWCRIGRTLSDVESAILGLALGGSTSIGAGLAESEALWNGRHTSLFARWMGRTPLPSPRVPSGALRRIILLSDGGHNSGRDPVPLSERMKERGVIIECVGIGAREDVDEVLLRNLASTVDGRTRYRFICDGDAHELAEQYRALGGALTR